MKALFAYDGRLAQTLLAVFQFFVVSVQFLLTTAPAAAVEAASGGEISHAAILLGGVAALPIGPGLYAALASMRAFLAEHGYPGKPLRRFWTAFAEAARRLWWLWCGAALLGTLLAYDAALYGERDAVFLAVTAGAALLFVAVVAVSCAALLGAAGRPSATLALALGAAAVRPLAPIAWLGIAALGLLLARTPFIGANLALFLPAGCAWAILVANAALGFDSRALRSIRAAEAAPR